MKEVVERAGLHPENRKERKEVDLAIRQIVGMKKEDKCNIVWKEVKVWLQNEEKKKIIVDGLKPDVK